MASRRVRSGEGHASEKDTEVIRICRGRPFSGFIPTLSPLRLLFRVIVPHVMGLTCQSMCGSFKTRQGTRLVVTSLYQHGIDLCMFTISHMCIYSLVSPLNVMAFEGFCVHETLKTPILSGRRCTCGGFRRSRGLECAAVQVSLERNTSAGMR